MNAEEARQLARRSIETSPLVESWVQEIKAKIKVAATSGKFSIYDPLSKSALQLPSEDEKRMIWKRLAMDGFEVIQHPDPDPGHPASRPYTEIRW